MHGKRSRPSPYRGGYLELLGVLRTVPSTEISMSTDIRTLGKGIYLIPRTSWGGVPQHLPYEADGLLIVLSWTESAKGYFFIAASGDTYGGIKWWSDTIVWKKT